jgi:type I restriction enzyme, S subunit
MSLPSLQNLDKSTWQKLPFGEIAKSIGERVDPTTTDLETYVGLEHIDAESIHIRRFGKREDVSGTKLRCYPGDVIFGRRRAYQRKAAICEFDGFCSAHSLVLRAIPEVVDPKLFPFFLHSDQFMHRAVDISVGGLSPTINWTKLKTQEFLLPPKDQQANLAELLWAADETVEKAQMLKRKLTKFGQSYLFNEILPIWERSLNRPLEFEKLDDLLDTSICNGVFKKQSEFGSGTLLINVTDIYGSFSVDPVTLDRVGVSHRERNSFSAREGDLIFNRSSLVKDGIGHTCIVPSHSEEIVFECHLMRARLDESKVDSRFVCRYCLSPFGRNYLMSRSQTTTMTTLNQFFLGRMPIPTLSLDEQTRIADFLDENDLAMARATTSRHTSSQLLKSLINQIF